VTERFNVHRLRELLRDLCRLAAERAEAEVQIQVRRTAESDAVTGEYQAARNALAAKIAQQRAAADADYRSASAKVVAEYQATHAAARTEYERVVAGAGGLFEAAQKAAQKLQSEARWEALAVFEAAKANAAGELQATLKMLAATAQEIDATEQAGRQLYAQRRPRWWTNQAEPTPATVPDQTAPPPLEQLVAAGREQLKTFSDRQLPQLFLGPTPLLMLVALWLAAIWPTGTLLGWQSWTWVAASGGVGFTAWTALCAWLLPRARRQTARDYRDLLQRLAEADAACQTAHQKAQSDCQLKLEQATEQRDSELRSSEQRYAQTHARLEATRGDELRKAEATYPPQWEEAARQRDQRLAETEAARNKTQQETEDGCRTETEQIAQHYEGRLTATQRESQRQWDAMAAKWRTGVSQFQAEVAAIGQVCDTLFRPWDATAWDEWQPPNEIPPVVRFGSVEVDLQRIENGVPNDATLHPPQTVFSIPAVVPFPDQPSLLLHVRAKTAPQATPVMHNIMLRMLTAIPPGRLRMTIVDPIGLGENFAAFMHLADYDEQLVTRRIWTESGDIERRLADLTEQMETIIQKYLRNQFESIGQYNAQAGEVAEPFHLLVIANFPANFTETSARRLTRLIVSGPRCGVFTLLSIDRERELPPYFDLAEIEPHVANLVWKHGRLVWQEAGLASLPLALDTPPQGELFTDIVRTVGAKAKEANRVEVPFERVAPPGEAWWSEQSDSEIAVPIGRAGATDLQTLRLGKGTSQHVLIAGKTGSGKSTLLHVLVTNLALRYGPEQVEFYLVDFKKGVEFKPYARFHLPHARVIAIESEREFGLSVLERLDAELKHRGDRFRSLAVQDLAGFRAAAPSEPMPRVLLIIDEFQELFVEDDKIAQTAALLLDRLVRQGRAFGIHVLLGSQTLAGAYSLARSTLGQMAVRIALECSDADAHLILSEDNRAARLLSRPGQAIYNDGNGRVEQNHPLQVAWLGDAEREVILKRLEQFAKEQTTPIPATIVFEGNIPADLADNRPLDDLLATATWPAATDATTVWLGDAVAIKPPTSATLRRQTGKNLLLVGQQAEAALGVLGASLVSIAAQQPPAADAEDLPGGQFLVLCGEPADTWQSGYLEDLRNVLPHQLSVAGPQAVADTIAKVAEQLARRQSSAADHAAPVYLVIYDLARFRELRKTDDEFGFGGFAADKKASPGQQLSEILSEGPAFGIHTLIWCDSGNSVHRFLSRQTLRDIELRVCFQMSETDSTGLIDSPAAGRLGPHRALLYDAQQGSLEKFRPYRPPPREWLDVVARQLQRHTGEDSP
jgi:S-DNA-T family DNA segregation ATPase FtsK/SpoIIIE